MAFLSWCSRRVGGLSLLALVSLCSWVLLNEIKSTRHDAPQHKGAVNYHFKHQQRPSKVEAVLVLTFAYYSLFIHILVTIFPFRACWGIWDVTRGLKRVTGSKKPRSFKTERKLSSSSFSSAETLNPGSSSTSSDAEDFEAGYYADIESDQLGPIHAVLIPNYKEDFDVLRETLDVLASHPRARCQYDVSWPLENRALSFGP